MTGAPETGRPLAQAELAGPPSSSAPDQLPAPGSSSTADQLPAPEEISGTLREILAGPDFVTFEAPVGNPFLDALVNQFFRFLQWIMELIDGAPGLVSALAILIPVLALVAAGVIVVRRRRGALRRTAKGQGPEAEEIPVTPSEWLRLATDRAGKGYLRSAATALYQGFLLTLDQRGTLAFHPSKTPGDYSMEIARSYSAGTDARAGGRFLNSFQGFSFGQEDPSDDGYADLTRLAREAGCLDDAPDGVPSGAPDDGSDRPAGAG